jgi:hypothetical protein
MKPTVHHNPRTHGVLPSAPAGPLASAPLASAPAGPMPLAAAPLPVVATAAASCRVVKRAASRAAPALGARGPNTLSPSPPTPPCVARRASVHGAGRAARHPATAGHASATDPNRGPSAQLTPEASAVSA